MTQLITQPGIERPGKWNLKHITQEPETCPTYYPTETQHNTHQLITQLSLLSPQNNLSVTETWNTARTRTAFQSLKPKTWTITHLHHSLQNHHHRNLEQNLKSLNIIKLQVTLETIVHTETEISNWKLRKSNSSNTNDECTSDSHWAQKWITIICIFAETTEHVHHILTSHSYMKTKFIYENRFKLGSEVNNKKHFFNHGLSQRMFLLIYEKKQNRFCHGISNCTAYIQISRSR
jgi:hypothetical protein